MIAHLPTLFLVIGYPLVWLEMFVFRVPAGRTTWSAWVLFGLSGFFLLARERKQVASVFREAADTVKRVPVFVRVSAVLIALPLAVIVLVSLYASFLPPHTLPELDVLNYHYTLVRQHLITHRFAHLPWSSADLWLLPVQFGLAPFWFSTGLPNKLPQFFFMMGLWAVCYRLAKRRANTSWPALSAAAVVAAVAGSHAFGVQFGTAMLDIVIGYVFIAAVDSFLDGNMFLSAVEFTFFFWSKPFMPLQFLLIAGLVLMWVRPWWLWNQNAKKFLVYFFAGSVFVAAPFLVKSFYYSGTPLYPFGASKAEPGLWAAAQAHLAARDAYGHGRSIAAFFAHFWRVAVPSNGVNNAFDYPLGLPFLLLLGPFLWRIVRDLRAGRHGLASSTIIVWWAVWWIGSQQSRWLYIPLVLLFIVSFSDEDILTSRGVWLGLILSVVLTSLSVFRANKMDFWKTRWETLRPQDQFLILSKDTIDEAGPTAIQDKEAAYATYEVAVTKPDGAWVLPAR
jgi:hypothetical protein